MAPKTLIAGIPLLIFGVILIIIGPIIYTVIHNTRDNTIDNNVLVKDPSSAAYPSFATNQFEGLSPQTYRTYYIFNITNVADAKRGIPPIYTEVGPFVYRVYSTLLNVSFVKGVNVTFTRYQRQIFVPSMSYVPDNSTVNVVNGAYLAILRTAGSETNLGVSVFATFLNQLNSTLYNNFVLQQLLPSAVSSTMPGYFLSPTDGSKRRQDWVTAAGPQSFSLVTAVTDVDDALAVRLFTPSNLYSLSSPTYYALWIKALDPTTANPTAGFLMNYWGVSNATVTSLGQWLRSVWIPTANPIILLTTLQAASTYDVAVLQWSSLAATSGQAGTPGPSLNTLNATAAPFPVEYAAWNSLVNGGKAAPIPLTQAKTIFSQFSNPVGWGTFLALLNARKFDVINATYALSTEQSLGLYAYSQYVVSRVLTPNFAAGSGLYTTQTIRNVIFGLSDPLLSTLSPGNVFAPVVNYTSPDDALARNKPQTRSLSPDTYMNFTNYESQSFINYWATPEYFGGSDGLNRPPHRFAKSDDYIVFESNLYRNVRLGYTQDVDIKGITAWRYRLTPENYQSADLNPANAKYFIGVNGFTNLTTVPRNGATGLPIYLSKPHFLDCDNATAQRVQFLTPTGVVQQGLQPNRTIHDTTIDVAYYTGQTINGRKTTQFNLQVNPSLLGVFSNVTSGTHFAPIFWVAETAQLTDDQANTFKSILAADRAALGIIIAFVVVGFLLLCAGVALIVLGARAMRNGGSQEEVPMQNRN